VTTQAAAIAGGSSRVVTAHSASEKAPATSVTWTVPLRGDLGSLRVPAGNAAVGISESTAMTLVDATAARQLSNWPSSPATSAPRTNPTGDDRPYRLQTAAGALWEIPVQWTLDDAAWLAHPSDPAGMFTVWAAELACARREERHVTLTAHPEIIGMAHRIDGLRRLLEGLAADGFASETHGAAVAFATQE
jgi:hypothetical protein